MLVLSRYIGEKVIIQTPTGDIIEVITLDDSKLGFSAPENYKILREELFKNT